jgi:hypothetical protein
METESSLLCSKEASTGHYPETDQSSPYYFWTDATKPILYVLLELHPIKNFMNVHYKVISQVEDGSQSLNFQATFFIVI